MLTRFGLLFTYYEALHDLQSLPHLPTKPTPLGGLAHLAQKSPARETLPCTILVTATPSSDITVWSDGEDAMNFPFRSVFKKDTLCDRVSYGDFIMLVSPIIRSLCAVY